MNLIRIIKLSVAVAPFVFAIDASAQVTFQQHTTLDSEDSYEIAKGDFNNDGKMDLIKPNYSNAANKQVTVLLNSGSGTFTGGNLRNFPAPPRLLDMAVGDFNEDGKLDAVACGSQNDNFSLLLGDGTGNLAAAVNFTTSDAPEGIAVGDMNKDGHLDVLVSHIGSVDDVYIFFGTGAGGFSSPLIVPIAINTGFDLAVADFNNDTNPDFAISALPNTGPPTVQIWNGNGQTSPTFTLGPIISGIGTQDIDARDVDGDGDMDILGEPGYALNNGTGSFATPVIFPQSAEEYAVGDLNNDGHPDIAATDHNQNFANTRIYLGDGAGAFTLLAKFEIVCYARGLEIVDVNNDGNLDVVAVGNFSGSGKIDILLGDGTGYFSNGIQKYPTLADPRGIVKGDFNEDGEIDIALCHSTSINNVTIYLGEGNGKFKKTPVNHTVGFYPFQIITMDYNEDGHIDLVTFNQSSSPTVALLAGAGNGQFTPSPDIPVSNTTLGRIVATDYNNDTHPDLIITGGVSPLINLMKGNGSGLDAPTTVAFSEGIYGIAAGDLTGDGKIDLAVSLYPANNFMMLAGDGTGGFTEGTKYTASRDQVAVYDFNNDSKLDVILYAGGSFGNDIYMNDGTGNFTASTFNGGLALSGLDYADMNGDGYKDLLIGSQASNSSNTGLLNVFKGSASGVFGLSMINKQYSGGNMIVVHDVNDDGKPDVISTSFNIYEDYLAVLINTTGPAACTPPTLTSSSSPTVCTGQDITLSVNPSGTAPFTYQWKKGTANIAGATSSSLLLSGVTSSDAGSYTCTATNSCGNATSSAIVVSVNATLPSAPTVTSASSCAAASVTLSASGSTNGNYRWYLNALGGTAISGQTNGTYTTPVLSITTTYYVSVVSGGCESPRTPVTATIGGTGCTNQAPVIATTSLSTVVEGLATIDLMTLISDTDDNLDNNSLKIIQPPQSGADASISNGILTIDYAGITFSGSDHLTIEVCDFAGSCAQQQLTIEVSGAIVVYSGISPNGDNFNATWHIKNIDVLAETKNNKVTLYNRWGDEVYSVTDYDNKDRVFSGLGPGGNELPSGTYFYRIEFTSALPAKTGYLVLKR